MFLYLCSTPSPFYTLLWSTGALRILDRTITSFNTFDHLTADQMADWWSLKVLNGLFISQLSLTPPSAAERIRLNLSREYRQHIKLTDWTAVIVVRSTCALMMEQWYFKALCPQCFSQLKTSGTLVKTPGCELITGFGDAVRRLLTYK